MNLCDLADIDHQRYQEWRDIDERIKTMTSMDGLEAELARQYQLIDLNGDGKLDRCELAKECIGAWNQPIDSCMTYSLDSDPLEHSESLINVKDDILENADNLFI